MVTKHELVNENAVFVGTAVEIVNQIRTQMYFERALSFREYLRQIVNIIEAVGGQNLYKQVFHDSDSISDEDLAERFVQTLIAKGMFKEG